MMNKSFCESLQQCKNMVQLSNAFITQIEHKIHINYYDKIVWATKYNNSVGVKYSEFDGDIEQATCAAIQRCAESSEPLDVNL
jgi:hypothetical protein